MHSYKYKEIQQEIFKPLLHSLLDAVHQHNFKH